MNCLFGLAQVPDARGDYAEAAACLGPANALAQQQRRAAGSSTTRTSTRATSIGSSPASRRSCSPGSRDVGDERALPVFVFGMPRSGTTLVEQVLASHSRVHGAGELPLARRAMDSLPSVRRARDLERACWPSTPPECGTGPRATATACRPCSPASGAGRTRRVSWTRCRTITCISA